MLATEKPPELQQDATEIKQQVTAILKSRVFCSSPRMAAFLRYVVESALQDDFLALKETCIGVAVFKRVPAYDPREDGIVRVEARRLRIKLQEYYENEGKDDVWLVTLPKGAYHPSFARRTPVAIKTPIHTPEPLPVDSLRDSGQLFPALPTAPVRDIDATAIARWAVIFVAVFILGVLATWLGIQRRHRNFGIEEAETRSLTTYIGQEMQATVSPDDKRFAFVWDGNKGEYNIYTRNLIGETPKQLTSGDGHHLHPAWSPDGRDLAYIKLSPDKVSLILIPSVGGVERIISEFTPKISPWHADARQITSQWSAAWTPDGRNLITNISNLNQNKSRLALHSIPLSGDAQQELTFPSRGSADFEPAVSPNDHLLAFFRMTSKFTGDIWLLNLQTSQLRQMTFDRSDVRGITWTPDSENLLYSGNRTGDYRIWSILVHDDNISEVVTSGDNATDPVLSPNGNRLIFTDSRANTNIWQQQLSQPGRPIAKPVRLISSSLVSQSARPSPDGTHITFVSNRSGHWEIWSCGADGLNPIQLTTFNGPLVDAPHWSPDSRQIVFEARPDGRSAIFSVSATGGKVTRLTDGKSNDKMPVWSHDGHWIYFNSDANGIVQIWKMHPDGSGQIRLTDQSGYDVIEQKNGPWIYFLSGDQYFYRVSRDGGESTQMTSLGKVGLSRYFDASDNALFFVDGDSEPTEIKRFNFRSQQLANVDRIDGRILSSTPSLSISPDGQKLLYALQESSTSDIHIMPFRSR